MDFYEKDDYSWLSGWKFQSLFYWIMDFYAEHKVILSEIVSRFQSLFYWIMDFYSKGVLTDRETAQAFQSLFYWIMDFYTLDQYTNLNKQATVSILVLLDYGFLRRFKNRV